jgi:hypothetical protein
VREGPRLLEHEQEEQAKLKWLRAAVQEGLEESRGEGVTLRSDREVRGLMRQLRK